MGKGIPIVGCVAVVVAAGFARPLFCWLMSKLPVMLPLAPRTSMK